MAESAHPRRKSTAATLDERLRLIRTCNSARLRELCRDHFGADYGRLPTSYIDSLGSSDQIIVLRACLISWTVTQDHILPREMQLRNVLSDRHGLNTIVSAGTGSGKTLPIALNVLLDDPDDDTITITISPLKRLQTTQTEGFNDKLRVRTLAINEGTPRDPAWWVKTWLISAWPRRPRGIRFADGSFVGPSGITSSCSATPWPAAAENRRLSPMFSLERPWSSVGCPWP